MKLILKIPADAERAVPEGITFGSTYYRPTLVGESIGRILLCQQFGRMSSKIQLLARYGICYESHSFNDCLNKQLDPKCAN